MEPESTVKVCRFYDNGHLEAWEPVIIEAKTGQPTIKSRFNGGRPPFVLIFPSWRRRLLFETARRRFPEKFQRLRRLGLESRDRGKLLCDLNLMHGRFVIKLQPRPEFITCTEIA